MDDMDDIWDEPVVHKAPVQQPLFLGSDDDGPTRPPGASERIQQRREPAEENLDDFVADLFDDIAPVDKTQPQRIHGTQNQNATGASKATTGALKDKVGPDKEGDASKEDEEPKRKARTIAKVDEERLLGDRGLPALIKEAQQFKPKGKGHEATDLDRLLSIYQFWAHNMFPKTQFRDTVDRVERVCRSRRMLVNMSMWRDAGRAGNHPERDPNKSETDEELDEPDVTTVQRGTGPISSTAATAPRVDAPQSRQVADDDLWNDLDDAIEQAQEQERQEKSLPAATRAAAPQPMPDDDDLEDWFNTGPTTSSTKSGANSAPLDGMEVDDAPPSRRMLSPPTADNWDDDLFA